MKMWSIYQEWLWLVIRSACHSQATSRWTTLCNIRQTSHGKLRTVWVFHLYYAEKNCTGEPNCKVFELICFTWPCSSWDETFAQVAVSMLKQYIVQHLCKFTSGPLAAKDGHSPTNPMLERWNETFQGYSTSLHAGLTEHTGPLQADGLAWLRVALGFCSPECCLHASDSKSFPLKLSSIVIFSLVGSSSLCLLNLTRCHWQSRAQPRMSHVLGWGLGPAFV